jgi:hypothetical protein
MGLRRRELSVDFRTASDGGLIGLPDPNVLLITAKSGRILVTHDRKTLPAYLSRFLKIHSSPGVIMVPQDIDIGAAIEDLLLIWAATEAEEWRNLLGFLPV